MLQSMGSLRFGQDLAIEQQQHGKFSFPDGTVVKIPPTNARDARDMGSIPGLGRFTRTLKGKQYYQPSFAKGETEAPRS